MLLSTIAGVAAIVILIIATRQQPREQTAAPPPTAETPETSQATPVASEPAPTPMLVSASPSAIDSPTNSDRSAVARELVKRLSEVEMQPGGVTPESAAKWNKDLESLVEQGTAAIAPLDEFFQSKVDVRFDTGSTNMLGEPTLRIAFIEVLFNVPAPDNVNLQEQLLQNTSDPAEVALLARQLEAQEPGKYQDSDYPRGATRFGPGESRAMAWT